MKLILTAATLALIATQSHALSCIRPDIAQTYMRAEQSDARIAILIGQIDFEDITQLDAASPKEVTVPGRFTGIQLGPNGQSAEFSQDISVSIGCVGPWCGTVSKAPNMISFVNVSDDGFAITGHACGGDQFSADDAVVLETLRACLRGDSCEPAWD